jgi:hypothetical protein
MLLTILPPHTIHFNIPQVHVLAPLSLTPTTPINDDDDADGDGDGDGTLSESFNLDMLDGERASGGE